MLLIFIVNQFNESNYLTIALRGSLVVFCVVWCVCKTLTVINIETSCVTGVCL